jgi:hypothetical protein
MNGSIGFIIFLIITIVSIVKRIREAAQEEEQRRSMPKTRPEDLPEATRRMLYGDTRVPTAGERQEPARPTVIIARPRQTLEENEEGPRPVPPPRPFAPPSMPKQAERQVQLPIPPRPMQPSRPVIMQPRPVQPRPQRTPVPTPNTAREITAGAGRMPDYAPYAARSENDGDWMYRDRLERGRQAERTQGQATARATAARKRLVFAAGTDLRRAILMNEILGPPIAMREPFGPFQNGPSL